MLFQRLSGPGTCPAGTKPYDEAMEGLLNGGAPKVTTLQALPLLVVGTICWHRGSEGALDIRVKENGAGGGVRSGPHCSIHIDVLLPNPKPNPNPNPNPNRTSLQCTYRCTAVSAACTSPPYISEPRD